MTFRFRLQARGAARQDVLVLESIIQYNHQIVGKIPITVVT